jgi:hypothetical protein
LKRISILIGLIVLDLTSLGYSAWPKCEVNKDFFVEANGEWLDNHVFTYTVLPGESVQLRVFVPEEVIMATVRDLKETANYRTPPGQDSTCHWKMRELTWKAPLAPGLYPLTDKELRGADGKSDPQHRVNLIVLVPSDSLQDGWLEDFHLGQYPKSKHGYEVPRGFIEVTKENKDTYISEHFKLGDFLCKVSRSFPTFEALDMRLVQKLEILIQKLSSDGYACTGLRILSGFRTPAYNRSRNAARESQHMYGMAADIVVDENGDGRMDDLDRDGKVTRKDADLLAKEALALNDVGIFVGGYASYGARRRRGPFVHVDIRGQSVTWKAGSWGHHRRHHLRHPRRTVTRRRARR